MLENGRACRNRCFYVTWRILVCQLEFCVPTAQREVTARAGLAVGLRHPLLAPHCVFRQIDRVVFEQKSFCRCLLASLVICFILHMFSLQFYSKCSTRFAPAEILLSVSARSSRDLVITSNYREIRSMKGLNYRESTIFILCSFLSVSMRMYRTLRLINFDVL